jgi:hypothetical protein
MVFAKDGYLSVLEIYSASSEPIEQQTKRPGTVVGRQKGHVQAPSRQHHGRRVGRAQPRARNGLLGMEISQPSAAISSILTAT